MKKLIQTRLHNPPTSIGNCFPTVIACIMDLDNPEDVIQIQEYYKEDGKEDGIWANILIDWLFKNGYEWYSLEGHLDNDEYYLVIGKTIRDTTHVCIYQNGELYHDPHPSQDGLTKIKGFETIHKIK